MTTKIWIAIIAFWIGGCVGKWDDRYGEKYGLMLGHWIVEQTE